MRHRLHALLAFVCVAVPSALAACTGAGATCKCDYAAWYDAKLNKSEVPAKASCVAINAADIATVSNGICVWANLKGQTPDINVFHNYPTVNNFACTVSSAPTNKKSDARCSKATAVSAWSSGGEPYKALVQSNGKAEATLAVGYYQQFNVALSSYNCEEQYSHWNCDDCRKAYARWVCAQVMPACTSSPCGETKPCMSLCADVVRKCPVTMGFTCPFDDSDYKPSICNAMGLYNGAMSSSSPASVVTIMLAAVAVVWAAGRR